MATGDRLLDANGNRILDANGNVMLDDGNGNPCCCGNGSGCSQCYQITLTGYGSATVAGNQSIGWAGTNPGGDGSSATITGNSSGWTINAFGFSSITASGGNCPPATGWSNTDLTVAAVTCPDTPIPCTDDCNECSPQTWLFSVNRTVGGALQSTGYITNHSPTDPDPQWCMYSADTSFTPPAPGPNGFALTVQRSSCLYNLEGTTSIWYFRFYNPGGGGFSDIAWNITVSGKCPPLPGTWTITSPPGHAGETYVFTVS